MGNKKRNKSNKNNNSNISTQCDILVSSNLENVLNFDIFISYSWVNKECIKLLYKSLVSHGFKVWIDEMYIFSGSMLFEEIDKGIRESKVILSCLSNPYLHSLNCLREMNLSFALNKPVIPLLAEDIRNNWPPHGQLGPLLAGKIYLDIATPEKMDTNMSKLIESIRSLLSDNN